MSALILALETSCDETAVAILRADGELLAAEVASQIDLHRAFGGVVPEVASRQHLAVLPEVLKRALDAAKVGLGELDAVAATLGPGLASSLMVGVAAAKGLALGLGRPFLGINHLEGHLLSPFFGQPGGVRPCVGLIVSGGHTLLVDVAGFRRYRRLGGTRDDAAGEAFDKTAKLLGLPYPGGPEIDALARRGDPWRFNFPRGLLHDEGLDFSFSGLKTAVRYLLPNVAPADATGPLPLADLCASFQQAVVDVLVEKTFRAAREAGRGTIAVSGGVSLNSQVRRDFTAACARHGLELLLAPASLCTDNATMIAAAAVPALAAGLRTPVETDVDPNLALPWTAERMKDGG